MVDMNRKLSQYENRIAIMSQEIERLRQDLRNKVENLNQIESRYNMLSQ